jgi:hypothetical protein
MFTESIVDAVINYLFGFSHEVLKAAKSLFQTEPIQGVLKKI